MPRRQSSVTALIERVSACHMSFYQGHLHTPLTEVSFKSRDSCTPMPLVRGRWRSLRVLVLLCRSSQSVVDRCGLQNEYPRHLTSHLWREVMRVLKVNHTYSMITHPMTQGLCEKYNGTQKRCLKFLVDSFPDNWIRRYLLHYGVIASVQ